jgi:hypothetical protein
MSQDYILPSLRSPVGGSHARAPPPESPDMKYARNRLGNLLNGIRNGDISVPTPGGGRGGGAGGEHRLAISSTFYVG